MRHRRLPVLLLLAALAACASKPGGTIDPRHLARIGTIDDRFQSYNVEMAEIIGGKFTNAT
ncbi:MAG: hypothetical protein ACTHOI_06080 [Sphingomicrobium sp.]